MLAVKGDNSIDPRQSMLAHFQVLAMSFSHASALPVPCSVHVLMTCLRQTLHRRRQSAMAHGLVTAISHGPA